MAIVRESMTVEEIQRHIEDLARNGEGADKRWALGKLKTEEEARAAIPPPLTEDEIDERVSRFLTVLGPDRIKRIMNRFLQGKGRRFYYAPPPPPPKPQGAMFPKSLPQIYALYPEAKSIPNFTRYWEVSRKKGTEARHQWLKEKVAWLEKRREDAKTALAAVGETT